VGISRLLKGTPRAVPDKLRIEMSKYKDTKVSYYILRTPAEVKQHVVPRASRTHGP
jgi:hypothetical protein